jgi:hypothetical protein
MFNYERLERSNFLTWFRISTLKEFKDALKNHKKKLRYLLDKYGDEINDTEEEFRKGKGKGIG